MVGFTGVGWKVGESGWRERTSIWLIKQLRVILDKPKEEKGREGVGGGSDYR